jgi:hypothetical protein
MGFAIAAGTLAGCSGGSKNSATTTPASSAVSGGSALASSGGVDSGGSSADAATTTAVTTAFVTFYNGQAPIDQRLALLQNADTFKQALASQASSPIIGQTSATVSAVSLTSPTQARVTYTISLSGTPALTNQTGIAVNDGGTWKVAAATFCGLLGLQAAAPAACTQASVTALPS